MYDEIPLKGGRVTQGVVRKGDYVLRPCCPNADFVHNVLKWLESKSVSAAPRFIGLADDGREITTFLEGIAPTDLGTYNGNSHWKPTDMQLCEVGKIIRTLHTALLDFPGCISGQTVCHNDFSPCNFMFTNDIPYAVFDWDAAGISDPINDVANATRMWSDIGNPENTPAYVGNTINTILDSYGLCNDDRKALINKIHEQIQMAGKSMYSFLMASQQQQKALSFQQWTNDCDSWLYQYQDQITPYFVKY